MQALNCDMNEQDMNDGCCGDCYNLCVMYYFSCRFFLVTFFLERAAHSLAAMIVSLFFYKVNSLPNAVNAFTVCILSRGT